MVRRPLSDSIAFHFPSRPLCSCLIPQTPRASEAHGPSRTDFADGEAGQALLHHHQRLGFFF